MDRGNERACDKDRASRIQLISGDLWEAGESRREFSMGVTEREALEIQEQVNLAGRRD